MKINHLTENPTFYQIANNIEKAGSTGNWGEMNTQIQLAQALGANTKVLGVFREYRNASFFRNLNHLNTSFKQAISLKRPNPKLCAKILSLYEKNLACAKLLNTKNRYKSQLGKNRLELVTKFGELPKTPHGEKILAEQRRIQQQVSSRRKESAARVEEPNVLTLGNTSYHAVHTKGDGSCGLHALYGEVIDGDVQFREGSERRQSGMYAKAAYLRTLFAKLGENRVIRDQYVDMIEGWLNQSVQGHADQQVEKIFPARGKISTDWANLKRHYEKKYQAAKKNYNDQWIDRLEQPRIFLKIMERINRIPESSRLHGKTEEEIRLMIKENPGDILSIIATDRDGFLATLNRDDRAVMQNCIRNINIIASAQKSAQRDFILNNRVFKKYTDIIKDGSYFLDMTELELAATASGKKVLLVSGDFPEHPKPINYSGSEAPIVIYRHKGRAHFSRAIPRSSLGTHSASTQT